MRDRTPRASTLALALIACLAVPAANGGEGPAGPPRTVLVEAFGPEGAGPTQPDLGGRVVSIRFPVALADRAEGEPSDPAGRRIRAYRASNGRGEVEPLPLVRVDGRNPGPGPGGGVPAAVRLALDSAPGVSIDLHLDGLGPRRTCTVKVSGRSAEVAGRDLVVGLALAEVGGVGRPGGGEGVVRRFETQVVRLARSGSRTLSFAFALEPGADPSRFRLAAFAQDRLDGRIHQAESLPWTRSHDHGPALARRAPKRPTAAPSALDLYVAAMASQSQASSSSEDDGSATCSACGSPFIPPPFGPIILRAGQVFLGPPVVTC